MKNWQVRRNAIEGNSETPDTLRFLERQLSECSKSAAEIPGILEAVIEESLSVYSDIVALAAVYKELYRPVQDFIESHPLARRQFQMSFEAKIVERRFAEDFLAKIAQNRRGSFNGFLAQVLRVSGRRMKPVSSRNTTGALRQ